jgi:hypothetical protein
VKSLRQAAGWPLRALGVSLFLGILAGAAGARSAEAQTTEALLAEKRLEYRSAKADYDAARSAYNVVERQFRTALTAVGDAHRAGDTDALERALRQAQDRSVPLQAQQQRLDDTKATLDSARQSLIEVIGVRQEQLLRQMDAAASTAQRNDLNRLFEDLKRDLVSLEAEAGDALRLNPVVLPDVTSDPRDGPDDVLTKALLLERYAALADTAIQDTDRRLEELTTRMRNERRRADLVAGVNRFDDTRLPVITGAPPGDRSSAADSTGAGARPLTLDERINVLQEYRRQLEMYRDQVLIRAQEFRRKLGSVA